VNNNNYKVKAKNENGAKENTWKGHGKARQLWEKESGKGAVRGHDKRRKKGK
jgi:hypothetical protein